jgi:predicted O-linked N-acetylglucosamine transferase (SPINDLY family)
LWHGVPVIAMAGNRSIARGGMSVLQACGCTQWLAQDEAEYIAIATSLAGDLEQLQQIRAGLRRRLQQSDLLDAKGYTLAFEKIFRDVWREWCATARPMQP